MSAGIIVYLAGEPKGKGRPRIGRGGHGRPVAFTPAATRSYEAALRYAAQETMRNRPLYEGPLSVEVEARMPVPASWSQNKRREALAGHLHPTGKPDLDNILKTLDALNEVVWRDDKQIVWAQVVKVYSHQPALWVRIMPLREPVAAAKSAAVRAAADGALDS